MTAAVRWYSEAKTSVIMELVEPVTWEEFRQSIRQSYALVREVKHRVDLIALVPPSMPEGNAFQHLSQIFTYQPENLGIIIVVVEISPQNPALQFSVRLSALFGNLFPKKSPIIFAQTLEEALVMTAENPQR